jgi:hypothetical protein
MIEFKEGAKIFTETDEGEYHNVEGKSLDYVMLDEAQEVEGIIFNKNGEVKLPIWHCKECNLDNQGVICGECKMWYNQTDPNCRLK